MNNLVCAILFVIAGTVVARAGIYSSHSDTTHGIDPAIASNDIRLIEWANFIDPTRTTFSPGGSITIDQSGGVNSLGDLSGAQVAAGVSPGTITVTFPSGIRNGDGQDFAVFENGGEFFDSKFRFAELAHVEVSTDGSQFARFSSIALNQEADLITDFGRAFAGIDTTNVFNLAGKHAGGFGTPFDLEDLSKNPLVTDGTIDLSNIQFVRLIDIPGDGSFTDSQGNAILDPWLTVGGTAGFDFFLGQGQGVGVFNSVAIPEPAGMLPLAAMLFVGARRQRTSPRKES